MNETVIRNVKVSEKLSKNVCLSCISKGEIPLPQRTGWAYYRADDAVLKFSYFLNASLTAEHF